MVQLSFLTTALLAAGSLVHGYDTKPYKDTRTGITFQAYSMVGFHNLRYQIGISLPQKASKDCVAQFVSPLGSDTTGWGGAALGGEMLNGPLAVAWPFEGKIIASLRKASDKYFSPPVYSGPAAIYRIEKGTWINETHFSYTFLCKDCLDGTEWSKGSRQAKLGFAFSLASPVNGGHHGSAYFNKHSDEGSFSVDVAGARSSIFETYASWANRKVDGNPPIRSVTSTSSASRAPSMPPTPSASTLTPSRSPTPSSSGSPSRSPSASPIWSTFVQPAIPVPTTKDNVPATKANTESVAPVSPPSSAAPDATLTVSVTVSGPCPTVTVTAPPVTITATVEPVVVAPTAVDASASGSTIVAPVTVQPASTTGATTTASVCTAAPTTRRKAKRALRAPRRPAADYEE